MRTLRARLALVPLTVLIACGLLGCGGADVNTGRHHVSGNVSFQGAPVALGTISFTPDPDKNKDGAQGSADIKEGAYDTRNGRGSSGGAFIVRIEGFDGNATPDLPFGKLIFFHEEKTDLPQESATRDFVVPPEAAKNVATNQSPV